MGPKSQLGFHQALEAEILDQDVAVPDQASLCCELTWPGSVSVQKGLTGPWVSNRPPTQITTSLQPCPYQPCL